MSEDELAISLRGVGKEFTKYTDTPAFINAIGGMFTKTKQSKLWAVRDVDLEVKRGECIAVIGRNGAGKSTLLQMLCGVTAPSEGRVLVKGRIAPLISVGVGFHPELTGRENIYVNATILGLTKRQIDERFDAIVEFSELGDFIDTPVKFYSSGMYVRLGFAVAVQIDPDVLLIDEVLAVGDLAFQMKCFERLNEVRRSGATVVFVTHNLSAVRMLCDRAIVIDHGTKVFDGEVDEAVGDFLERLRTTERSEADLGFVTHQNGIAQLGQVTLANDAGRKRTTFDSTDDIRVRVRVEALSEARDVFLAISLHAADGTLVYRETTYAEAWDVLQAGEVADAEILVSAALPTGSYTLEVRLRQKPQDVRGTEILLDVAPQDLFHVRGRNLIQGLADLGRGISVETPRAPARRKRAATKR